MIEWRDGYRSRSVAGVTDFDRPRLTANLAVLDILLHVSASRVERDLDRRAAVRTVDHRAAGSDAVVQWQFLGRVIVFAQRTRPSILLSGTSHISATTI